MFKVKLAMNSCIQVLANRLIAVTSRPSFVKNLSLGKREKVENKLLRLQSGTP